MPSPSSFENSPVLQWMFKAIDEDKLLFIGITSQAQAKIPVEGFAFGMGKSTLALWLSYLVYKRLAQRQRWDVDSIEGTNKLWDVVFQNLFLRPQILDHYVFGGPEAPYKPPITIDYDNSIPLVLWDDMEESVGKFNHASQYLQTLAARLKKGRDWFKILLGTFPMGDDLFKRYRFLFHMELIVPQRGIFEFQRTLYARKFSDWDRTLSQAWYESESRMYGFPPLPPHIWNRYKAWIKEEHAILDKQRWKLEARMTKKEEEPEPIPQTEASKAALLLAQARWGKH